MDLAQKECQSLIKTIKNASIKVYAQLDCCILASLNFDWKSCDIELHKLWSERVKLHTVGEANEIDLKIGLFLIALQNFKSSSQTESKSMLEYIRDSIIPILLEKEVPVSVF